MSSERRTYKNIEKESYYDKQSTADNAESAVRAKLTAIEHCLRHFIIVATARAMGLPDEKGAMIVNHASDVELGLICRLLVNSPHYTGPDGEQYPDFDRETIFKLYSIAIELSKSAWEKYSEKGGK